MVTHTYNPRYSGGGGRITEASPGKGSKTLFQKNQNCGVEGIVHMVEPNLASMCNTEYNPSAAKYNFYYECVLLHQILFLAMTGKCKFFHNLLVG
jgi:hypothetical protein